MRLLPYFVVLLSAGVTAQVVPRLLDVVKPDVGAQHWHQVSVLTDPTTVRSKFIQVRSHLLRLGSTFVVDLFGSSVRLSVVERSRSLRHSILVAKGPEAKAVFAVGDRGALAAAIDWRGKVFSLGEGTLGSAQLLREVSPGATGATCGCKDHAASESQLPRTMPAPVTVGLAPSPATIIDVAGFYTPAATKGAGSQAAMEAELALRIAMANAANTTGKVGWTFRLVYMAPTKYVASGRGGAINDFMGTSDGKMDEVHKARSLWGADLMVLITDPQSSFVCGVSRAMRTLSTKFRTEAFSFTWRKCLANHTLTHEMGHNLGLHHSSRGGGLYAYSYGFSTADNKFRTIMALGTGTRLNLWSSPNTKHQTYTMGSKASEDSARSNRNVRATVAAFYPTKTPEACEVKGGIAGAVGLPELSLSGTTSMPSGLRLNVDKVRDGAPGVVVVGSRAVNASAYGGVLVPSLDLWVYLAGGKGRRQVPASALTLLPTGATFWVQAAFLDAAAKQGVAASPGLKVRIP